MQMQMPEPSQPPIPPTTPGEPLPGDDLPPMPVNEPPSDLPPEPTPMQMRRSDPLPPNFPFWHGQSSWV